ncbi:Mitochondrial distribution and morphology protein 12 [Kalmanozyma brasiliensis GHG001]|uniref:Mitochondrial distribution and morphology protein 12 n=1 Tax=Kalmanozyma brasiliensis (strain GHG001) TaxID=1365824 RepID=UPI0028680BD9|nr:Mitochondrial distribution and morphology protein 12 [Kalmanozyma brasiliensis GHG001]EST07527.2 Mitochondrial distribution and morphology protein 12 [Kalmanozyma brasiliensis GHG001]
MSLDLDWSLLDDELSVRFLETINRALESSSTSRPSFLGEIRFENLQFGADPPDVAIRSITDIWPDFVSIDDPPLRRRGTRHATPASNATTLVESPTETFAAGHGGEMPLRTYTQFDDAVPPNRIHGPASVISASVAGSVPATPGMGLGGANGYYQQWSTALASRGIRAAGLGGSSLPQTQVTSPVEIPPSPGYFQHWQQQQQSGPSHLGLPYSANNSRQTSFDATSLLGGGPGPQSSVSQIGAKRDSNSLHPPLPGNGLHWNGTGGRPSLRSTPAASYRSLSGQISPNEPREATPAPSSASQLPSLQMRLSLHWPTTTFRLTVTTSILINYPSPAFMSLPLTLCITGFSLTSGLIVALEGEHQRAHICLVEEDTDVSPAEGKKVSAGMSVLPQLTFESEVGEHEKHVLKNVGKVEKFVAEVIRKGLEDELVYPNYYTIDLPGSKGRT